jgi:hypothetical protein
LAENRAERNIPMTMQDWAKRIDDFLEFDEREILQDGGKISVQIAKEKAETDICSFVNKLWCGMTVNTKMQFVLHFCKKGSCGYRIFIIIKACGVNVRYFLIKFAFA